jgi:hypothetical protein
MLRVTFIVRVALLLALVIWAGFALAYPGDNKPIRLVCDTLDRPSSVTVLWTDLRIIVGDQGSYTIDSTLTTDREIVGVSQGRFVTLYLGQDRIVLHYRGRESMCRVKD